MADYEKFFHSPSEITMSVSGAKARGGPWMKYHMGEALRDLLARTKGEGVELTYSGFMDQCGDSYVVGVQLGGMEGAIYYDMLDVEPLCGRKFVADSAMDIVPVSPQFVTDAMPCANLGGLWPTAQHKKHVSILHKALHDKVARVLQGTSLDWDDSDLGFFLAFKGSLYD